MHIWFITMDILITLDILFWLFFLVSVLCENYAASVVTLRLLLRIVRRSQVLCVYGRESKLVLNCPSKVSEHTVRFANSGLSRIKLLFDPERDPPKINRPFSRSDFCGINNKSWINKNACTSILLKDSLRKTFGSYNFVLRFSQKLETRKINSKWNT
jgi:hypothetical protein